MKRRVKILSAEQIELAKSMRLEKMAYKHIAKALDCSIKTVFDVCKGVVEQGFVGEKCGYKERFKEATEIRIKYSEGITRNDLAVEYCHSKAMISDIINNRRYFDENYNPPEICITKNSNFTIEEILSMRKRYDDGEDVWKITDDYRDRIKTNPTGTVRKICRREIYKNI
jgi:hypothetical protein